MNEKSAIVTSTSAIPERRRSRARTALLAGFGAVLILMAVICLDSLSTLSSLSSANARIRQDFLYREQTLEQVRDSLYESGNILRDFMLAESDATTQQALRGQLQSLREQTSTALNSCIQTVPAAQQAPFQNLAGELNLYWASLDPILTRSANDKPGQLDSLLRNEMLLQHAHTLSLATDVSAVNAVDLHDAEQRAAQGLAQFRRRLLVAAAAVFGVGLVLAVVTIMYASGLEKDIEQRYADSLRARRDLQSLSKRLVDTEERERRSISRELHDQVGQSLSALLMNVESLAAMPDEHGAFRRGLENIRQLAQSTVAEVRDMALLLRPSMLDDLGLLAAVEWQAREVSRRTGMIVETAEENVSAELPEEYKVCMYRVVQEALNNATKHARAKKVKIAVKQAQNHLQVTIEDDGVGFDASHIRGLGLLGMNERVAQMGGELKIDSSPSRGTRVRADLPLPSNAMVVSASAEN